MADKDDNPDYAGPEGNKLREEAQKFAEERGKCFDESKIAFEAGEKGKAKELSEKGKEAGRNMEDTNKRAAEVILKYRNDGKGDNYLDLHGLFLVSSRVKIPTYICYSVYLFHTTFVFSRRRLWTHFAPN